MIVLFNGPPGSGKDDACIVLEKYKVEHLSFKHELYKSVCDYFNVDYDWFMEGYNVREIKENLVEWKLGGRTRRQAMIYVAEEIIKPIYGKDYYAKQVSNQIDPTKNYCISDLGYAEELEAIVDKFGKNNVAVIQLEREGYDFSKDKRRYVGQVNSGVFPTGSGESIPTATKSEFYKTDCEVQTFMIYNNNTLEEFHLYVRSIFLFLEER